MPPRSRFWYTGPKGMSCLDCPMAAASNHSHKKSQHLLIAFTSMSRIPIMSNYCRLFIVATAILVSTILTRTSHAADTTSELPDIEHGKETFNTMCGVCHSVQQTGGPVEGPNLLGLVGREAASQPDFAKYSPALKASNLTWSAETLDRFLVNPMAMVPGTLMPMLIRDDKTRADVIAYLATLK